MKSLGYTIPLILFSLWPLSVWIDMELRDRRKRKRRKEYEDEHR